MAATIIEGDSLTIVCNPRKREWPFGGPGLHSCWEADAVISKRDGSESVSCVIMTGRKRARAEELDDFVRALFSGFYDDRVVTDRTKLVDLVLAEIARVCRLRTNDPHPRIMVGGDKADVTIDLETLLRWQVLRPVTTGPTVG